MGTSPVQRLLGRCCKTLLPTTTSCLQPAFSTDADVQACSQQRQRQPMYYVRHAKQLRPIPVGETLCVHLPGQSTWSMGTCIGLAGPRSYD